MNNTDDEENLKLTTVEIEIKKDINPKNYQFEITSDNFLSGKPPFLNKENYISEISRIHCALLKNNVDISSLSISYKYIPNEFLGQLMTLHHELSPIDYGTAYFTRHLLKKTHFALGAFVTIENEEFLIGYVLSEIASKKKFKGNVPNVLHQKNCWDSFKNFVMKTTEDKFAHLSNIGVINEFRGRKIGKELINQMIKVLQEKDVIAIYSNIIEHNCSGIKFYEKIGWDYGGVIFGYFNFEHNYFNAQVYYTILNNKNNFHQVEIRGYNEPPIDRTCWFVKLCQYINKIIST